MTPWLMTNLIAAATAPRALQLLVNRSRPGGAVASGDACVTGGECLSGHCVDGHC